MGTFKKISSTLQISTYLRTSRARKRLSIFLSHNQTNSLYYTDEMLVFYLGPDLNSWSNLKTDTSKKP